MVGTAFDIKVDLTQTTNLAPWGAALLKNARTAMQDVFSQGLGTVRANERVKTGNMRNSTSNTNTATGAQITAGAGYSGFQNFGTRYMSGTHFMEAGLSQITSALPSRLTELLAI
jgi:HK97 gp10 family phage protein